MSRSLSLNAISRRFRAIAISLVGVLAIFTAAAEATIFSTTSDRDTVIVAGGTAQDTTFSLPDSYVGRGITENRALVDFDISSIGPPVFSVSAISLTLHVSSSAIGSGQALTPEVHAISLGNDGWGHGTTTWNNQDVSGPTPWVGSSGLYTSGTDYAAATLASATFSGPGSVPSTIVFNFAGDLTGLVNGWLSGSNAGLLIFDGNYGSLVNSTYFGFTGTAGDDTLGHFAPELSITYATTPEPTSCGLMSLGLLGLMAWRRRSA